MNATPSSIIAGLVMIIPKIHRDQRGEHVETFSADTYEFYDRTACRIQFVEDDISISHRNVLRGLHGDSATWKLIQCFWGEVFFVVADMRTDSPTYLRWQSFTLSDQNRMQVLVPAGCVNGHFVVSEKAVFSYKQSQYYSGMSAQITVRWDDPLLNINWPIRAPILSERDANAALLDRQHP
jgi:dTDP-4-dehydrorhamnose 3,5-epimerase